MTNTIICVPYELIDKYIRKDRIHLNNKSYSIVKTVGKDTYIEVTYRLE